MKYYGSSISVCKYNGVLGPFWIVGVKPFGLYETAMETKRFYKMSDVQDEFVDRVKNHAS